MIHGEEQINKVVNKNQVVCESILEISRVGIVVNVETENYTSHMLH